MQADLDCSPADREEVCVCMCPVCALRRQRVTNTAVRGTPGCTPPLLSPLPFHLPAPGPQILSLSSPFLLCLLSQRLVHPQPFSPLSLVGVRMVVDRVTPPPHTLSRTIRPNIRLLSCKHVAIRGASALVRGWGAAVSVNASLLVVCVMDLLASFRYLKRRFTQLHQSRKISGVQRGGAKG